MNGRFIGRVVLAAILIVAGIGHFANTSEFIAQVPPWAPAPEFIIYASGILEIMLGVALLTVPKYRVYVGLLISGFFVVIFPGNISQFVTQTDAFGLDSDLARFIRLLFQPLLVFLAIWSTGAWTKLKVWAKRHP